MNDYLIENWYVNQDFRKMPSGVVKISNYIPRAINFIFSETFSDIPDNCYLACPKYSNGDIQIGGTGSSKKGEMIEDALYRESVEELSITPSYDEIVLKKFGKVEWALISTLNFRVSQRVKEILDDFEALSSDIDDRKRKVGFMYWAPIEYWRRSQIKPDQNQTDNITDIAFISKADVSKIIRFST